MQSLHCIEQASTCAVCRYFHYLVSFCLVRNMERILYGPGDKHISCARRWACFVNALILFDCTTIFLVACLFDNCRRAFKMPVNGYVRCWVHFLSPPELSLSALHTVASQSTITGNNASTRWNYSHANVTLHHGSPCCSLCGYPPSAIFCPLRPKSPSWRNAPLELLRRLMAIPP